MFVVHLARSKAAERQRRGKFTLLARRLSGTRARSAVRLAPQVGPSLEVMTPVALQRSVEGKEAVCWPNTVDWECIAEGEAGKPSILPPASGRRAVVVLGEGERLHLGDAEAIPTQITMTRHHDLDQTEAARAAGVWLDTLFMGRPPGFHCVRLGN